MLVNHTDASGHRIARPGEVLLDAIQKHFTCVCLIQTVKNVHQGGFTSTIFPEQRVNLTGFYHQVNGIICHQAAKALSNSAQFKFQQAPLRAITLSSQKKWAAVKSAAQLL